jgi:polysaccharide export outer membrane protein
MMFWRRCRSLVMLWYHLAEKSSVGANVRMRVFENLGNSRGNLNRKNQDHGAFRPFVLSSVICFALTVGTGRFSSAQTSPAPPSSDCNTSLSAPCPQTPGMSQPSYPINSNPNDSTGLRGNQYPRSSDDSTYVDSAGRSLDRQTDLNNRLFPPDPTTDFQRLAKSSTGEMLPIFGRDLFMQVPSTFAPGDELGVTPDYVIGPGDEVLLRFWGTESFNGRLTVDRSGAIYVPKVGSISVAGLHFSELQQQIATDLSRTHRNLTVSVSLGRLRSIQIYVVGEARRPGAYTVSALSTVLNALFASGGPNVQGSLRHIQVRRAGQTLSEFDLYDLVLRGDKSKDVRLEQGDTIFIPAVAGQAALAGSVRHPAIYELGSETTLADLLKTAGGFSATASPGQISLERIETDGTRHAVTVTLDSSGSGMQLRDGDVLFAGHITAGYRGSVTIRGNLANPGRFAWHEGMRLNEIIPDRRSLLTNDYWRERNRLGVPVPLFEPLENSKRPATQDENANGTRRPYPEQPGSEDDREPSSQSHPDSRESQNYTDNQVAPARQVGLATAGLQDQSQETAQQPTQNSSQQYGTSGQTRTSRPNLVRIPAPEIDWSYAVIERLNPETLKSSLISFNLGKLVQDHDPAQNLELQPGDVVTILSQNDISVPQEERTKYVRLDGEFPGAGLYSVFPGETLDQLVRRAGGLTSKAYLYGSSFTRESAREFQQQRLDEYISTLSADLERTAAVRAASSPTGIVDPNALTEQRSLVSQLRQLRATGRVVLEFSPISSGVASIPNIPLEDGDAFRVPSKPDTVSVIGAVYGQNIFLYNSERKVGDYLALAGKPNRIADRKHAFIIRADGSIFSRERAEGVWSNEFNNLRINAGDTIVIPEKPIRPTAIRELIDYSQILSSFGIAAAAIDVIR